MCPQVVAAFFFGICFDVFVSFGSSSTVKDEYD